MEPLNNLKKIRLEKLAKIQELGIDPYPTKSVKKDIVAACLKSIGKNVQTAGRLIGLRAHGGSTFADLMDESGKIQLFFSQDKLSTVNRELLTLLDIGDFVEVSGKVDKTKAGETTIFVEGYKLLAKSIRPIPTSFYGLKDVETRLRKRYVDLIVNEQTKQLFVKKAKFWQSVRSYLADNNFLEVETPALESVTGGADATPFITHHNALNQDYYLRISLELYQKRLLVGGFEKVFEIGKIFRNEGIDNEHLQDYLQMEFYWAYANFNNLMDFLPKYYEFIVNQTLGSHISSFAKNQINWSKNWPKIDYFEAIKSQTGLDLEKDPDISELAKTAEKVGAKVQKNMGEGRLIDLIYKKTVRAKIIQPSFLINHPISVSPLAKKLASNPKKVQRVQILAAGTEVGNGYSELNNPIDQEERFKMQQDLREAGDKEAQMYDKDFVEALEYGMPPAAGFGLSQRFFAVIVDKPIRETQAFPTLRSE